MIQLSTFLRPLAGGAIGAGLASLASVATATVPAFGPAEIIVFGEAVPVLPALFGLIGLLMARRVAPASDAGARLGRTGNAALTALLALGVLALVINGQRQPLVALGWSIGLGYSGLAFVELVASAAMVAARAAARVFVAGRGEASADSPSPGLSPEGRGAEEGTDHE